MMIILFLLSSRPGKKKKQFGNDECVHVGEYFESMKY